MRYKLKYVNYTLLLLVIITPVIAVGLLTGNAEGIQAFFGLLLMDIAVVGLYFAISLLLGHLIWHENRRDVKQLWIRESPVLDLTLYLTSILAVCLPLWFGEALMYPFMLIAEVAKWLAFPGRIRRFRAYNRGLLTAVFLAITALSVVLYFVFYR